MSLRRIAPPLVCRCVVRGCISGGGGRANNPLLIPRRLDNNNATNSIAKRRGFSSTPKQSEKKMSAEEVDAALEQANESMKAYYSFPPEKLMVGTTHVVSLAWLLNINSPCELTTFRSFQSVHFHNVQKLKKAKFEERHRDKQFYLQLALGECFAWKQIMGRRDNNLALEITFISRDIQG